MRFVSHIIFFKVFYFKFFVSHYLFLDFVLNKTLQQGHLLPAIVKKRQHKEHLFCPALYLEPLGILFPLRLSHIPLQEYPIMIYSHNIIYIHTFHNYYDMDISSNYKHNNCIFSLNKISQNCI